MKLVKHEYQVKSRLLYVDGQSQWRAKGGNVFYSQDSGISWKLFTRINSVSISSFFSRFRLSSRLFRAHVDHLIPLAENVIVFGFKQIYVFNKYGKVISQQPIFGSRPLSICVHRGIIYYGEYRSNTERSPIRIFKSEDKGLTWETAWEFTNIRHVHGVFSDPCSDNAIWVTTGDSDKESAIWRTGNEFKSLNIIAEGSQQTRAVQLLFNKEYVYFGSDTPNELNYIYRMTRGTHEIEKLTAVANSVFYGCKVGEDLFFSTAVEPSNVNVSKYAEVWHSGDGKNWVRLCAFKKDRYSMKYFQYGQVFFPAGPGDGKHLWITPMSTENDQHISMVFDRGENG